MIDFQSFWQKSYSKTLPVGYLFRHNYPERWLRIHSLPESKRYAETDDEWEILLERQNKVITDLLGQNGECYLIIDEYWLNYNKNLFKNFNFRSVDRIDNHEIDPEAFEEKEAFSEINLVETKWDLKRFKTILKAIANDQCEAFFIGIKQQCLITPYDGGVDLILRDKETRDHYKEKYKAWLSAREDGL